jgi:hypothetical protein
MSEETDVNAKPWPVDMARAINHYETRRTSLYAALHDRCFSALNAKLSEFHDSSGAEEVSMGLSIEIHDAERGALAERLVEELNGRGWTVSYDDLSDSRIHFIKFDFRGLTTKFSRSLPQQHRLGADDGSNTDPPPV